MVPYRRSVEQPLLPYEKRLIVALGCSEQEYRLFAKEVERRYKQRPEEYAHIPNIQAILQAGPIGVGLAQSTGLLAAGKSATTVALTNIAVGFALTAASMLLAPKPQQPKGNEIRRRQLGGRRGKDIYAPSFGFDSLQELADYGQTVPIAFTRRKGQVDPNDQNNDKGTGGLLISPQMVWSRMKSWGGYQVAEIVALAGQGNMAKPDLAGIFLGNNALDGIYQEYFDFYWNGGFEELGVGSRIRAYNLRYGNLAIDGDRDNPGLNGSDQVFYAPTRGGGAQPAFCGAFTPTSQTRFGVYSGVPNGTPFRPNWRIISIPKDSSINEKKQGKNQQKKYVDEYLMDAHPKGGGSKSTHQDAELGGQPGTGTNYARRIGIIKHRSVNGTETTVTHTVRETTDRGHESWQNVKKEVDCNVGDTIEVLIGKNKQEEQPFSVGSGIEPVSLSDVRSAVQAESARYDAMFKQGSTWMIGRTTWTVISRSSDEPYDGSKSSHVNNGVLVTLKCIETWSQQQKTIGIVDREAITEKKHVPFTQEGDDIHEAWYPLLKYEIGTIQNTRACDVTEIGIKSQVWAKFENITNFNTVPAAGLVVNANKDNIVLTEGKLTAFAHRMAVFALDVRPSNYDSARSNNNGWVNASPHLFAVIGRSPVDVYSFIRIQHPDTVQFEYRLRPLNSAIFVEQDDGSTEVFVLDGGRTGIQSWLSNTTYGQFQIHARGYKARPKDYQVHLEMAAYPDKITDEEGRIDIKSNSTEKDTSTFDVTHLSTTALTSGSKFNPGDAADDKVISNVYSFALDATRTATGGLDPWFLNFSVGHRQQLTWEFTGTSGKEVYMILHLIVYERSYADTSKTKWWRVERIQLLDPSGLVGRYSDGETFIKKSRNLAGVQFAFKYQLTHPTRTVTNTLGFKTTATRLWQKYSGMAEVSHYGDLISRSCDSGPEFEVVYVNETLAEETSPNYDGCAMAGLKLKSSDNFNQLDQLRTYLKNGIEVERLTEGGTGSSNLLTDLLWYLVTNKDTGAGTILNSALVDKALLTTTGHYLEANKLYWDDVIAEPVNLRSWLSEQAPSVLCFVSLKNGKMSLEPALPYDGNHEIDATNPVTISAMFTEGNIIEDSLEFTWLELEERKMFQAAIIYQQSRVNQFPERKTLIAYYGTDNSDLPIEEFTFSHITSDEHAAKVARYFLSLRKNLTHTITFKTLPWGLNLEAGKFIRVASEMSPYRPDNNGIIQDDGTVLSISALADGDYDVYYWERQSTAISEGVLTIKDGKSTGLFNSVFSLKTGSNVSSQIYQVEALDVDQDGIVTIKASNYAVDSNGVSQLAIDVLDTAGTITIE